MIEWLAVVAVSVAILSLTISLVITARCSSNSIAQVMASCAESNRQFMVYSEKAVNRTMAAANPLNYRSMRESSGTVEGAQAPVDGHYEKPPSVARRPKAQMVARPAPADRRDELNGVYEEPRNVGSTVDFEIDGGNR